jgi:catechol 2,3-dioxygenase-like lactoylglutathione lyase family enzyme
MRISSLVCAVAGASIAFAQGPQPAPAGEVVGVGNFSHIVSNLDKSVEFYRDVLGLELATTRPFAVNPAIQKLGNTGPSSQSRLAILKVPGLAMGVELIEYKDVDRKPLHPRFYDPGAANLALRVRDVDAVFERIQKFGAAKVITAAGKPVTINTPNGMLHAVFVQDPDGFVVELNSSSAPPAATAPAGNILGGAFEVTVADSEKSVNFYKDLLGFDMKLGAAFNPNKEMAATAGAPGASFRQSRSSIPGTSVPMTLIEFKDIDRKPLAGRIQDPGTAILQLRVRDAAALTKKLKDAGVPVITTGGEPVDINGAKIAIVRDPNHLYLELIQAPSAAAKKQ